jgi:hypothetical protein
MEPRPTVPLSSQQPFSSVPQGTTLRSTQDAMTVHNGASRATESGVKLPVQPTSHPASRATAVLEHRSKAPLASAPMSGDAFRVSESRAAGPQPHPIPSQIGSSHATVYHVNKTNDAQLRGITVEAQSAPIVSSSFNAMPEPVRSSPSARPVAIAQRTQSTFAEKQLLEVANTVSTPVSINVASPRSLLSPSGLEVSPDQLKTSAKKSSPLGILNDLHSPVPVTVTVFSASVDSNPAKAFPVPQVFIPVEDTKPSFTVSKVFDDRWPPQATATLPEMLPKKVSPDTQPVALTPQQPVDVLFEASVAGQKIRPLGLEMGSQHPVSKQQPQPLPDHSQHKAHTVAGASMDLSVLSKDPATVQFVKADAPPPAPISLQNVVVPKAREVTPRDDTVPQMHAPTPQSFYHNTSSFPVSPLKIIDPRSPAPNSHVLQAASQKAQRGTEVDDLEPPEHSAATQSAPTTVDLRQALNDTKASSPVVPASTLSSRIPQHERRRHNVSIFVPASPYSL